MNCVYSNHAKEQLKRRKLSSQMIEKVIKEPDAILVDEQCVKIFQKVVCEREVDYLYRVFVNHCKEPSVIITCYKTSKISKYED